MIVLDTNVLSELVRSRSEARVVEWVDRQDAGMLAITSITVAELVAERERGRPVGISDAQIAAICSHHGATLATRNTRDFASTGIDIVDPWMDAGGFEPPTSRV